MDSHPLLDAHYSLENDEEFQYAMELSLQLNDSQYHPLALEHEKFQDEIQLDVALRVSDRIQTKADAVNLHKANGGAYLVYILNMPDILTILTGYISPLDCKHLYATVSVRAFPHTKDYEYLYRASFDHLFDNKIKTFLKNEYANYDHVVASTNLIPFIHSATMAASSKGTFSQQWIYFRYNPDFLSYIKQQYGLNIRDKEADIINTTMTSQPQSTSSFKNWTQATLNGTLVKRPQPRSYGNYPTFGRVHESNQQSWTGTVLTNIPKPTKCSDPDCHNTIAFTYLSKTNNWVCEDCQAIVLPNTYSPPPPTINSQKPLTSATNFRSRTLQCEFPTSCEMKTWGIEYSHKSCYDNEHHLIVMDVSKDFNVRNVPNLEILWSKDFTWPRLHLKLIQFLDTPQHYKQFASIISEKKNIFFNNVVAISTAILISFEGVKMNAMPSILPILGKLELLVKEVGGMDDYHFFFYRRHAHDCFYTSLDAIDQTCNGKGCTLLGLLFMEKTKNYYLHIKNEDWGFSYNPPQDHYRVDDELMQ